MSEFPAIQIPKAFAFLLQPKRYKVMYGGRGGAKSHAIARTLLVMAMNKPLRIICAREIQKSIKDSVHTLLADIIRAHGLTGFYEIQETVIKGRNGSEFKFRGLKYNTSDMKSLEGADIVWVEEAENVSHNSWEILIPTIRKDCSEIWVSFNPKNATDPTYERFVKHQDEDIIARPISWRDNPFFPAVLEKERVKLQNSDPEAYAHIWEGQPDSRRTGSVYAKNLHKARQDGRIGPVPYDPSSPVWTVWDLGFGDATAIWWVQRVGRELRWLDYYENSGEFIAHYAEIVRSKPYTYAPTPVVLPHDGAANNIRGSSVAEQLAQLGLKNIVLERETNISGGIDRLRMVIETSCFDEKNCKDGLHALEHYRYEWNEDRGVYSDKPYHDWTSHAADAARYVALSIDKMDGLRYAKVSDSFVKHLSNQSAGGSSWMGT